MYTNEPVTREQEYSCANLLKKNTRTYQHFAPYKLNTNFEPSFCSGNWGYRSDLASEIPGVGKKVNELKIRITAVQTQENECVEVLETQLTKTADVLARTRPDPSNELLGCSPRPF